MPPKRLKIPKTLREVTLWVHPEGKVVGSLFLRQHSVNHAGSEEPLEVLNQPQPFVVLQRTAPEELRFYNRASIIRLEYAGTNPCDDNGDIRPLRCQLHMMDGSLIAGSICESLPPDQSRLFDYLNRDVDRFIKIYLEQDDRNICLVNKSYIIQVTMPDGTRWEQSDDQ